MKKLKSITITTKYELTKVDHKIIKSIKAFINKSKFKNDYKFKHRFLS